MDDRTSPADRRVNLWRAGLGQVPEDVWAREDARVLVLAENALDRVPGALRGLPLLRRLDLRSNLLRELPHWVATELPALEKLDLRWNEVVVAPRLLDELARRGCVVLRSGGCSAAAGWMRGPRGPGGRLHRPPGPLPRE